MRKNQLLVVNGKRRDDRGFFFGGFAALFPSIDMARLVDFDSLVIVSLIFHASNDYWNKFEE